MGMWRDGRSASWCDEVGQLQWTRWHSVCHSGTAELSPGTPQSGSAARGSATRTACPPAPPAVWLQALPRRGTAGTTAPAAVSAPRGSSWMGGPASHRAPAPACTAAARMPQGRASASTATNGEHGGTGRAVWQERPRVGAEHPLCCPCPRSTCRGGRWICTQDRCAAECAVLGGLHYVTFDHRRFSFPGACEYTLVQVWGCRAGGRGGGVPGAQGAPCLQDFVEGMLRITAEQEACGGHQPLSCLRALSITVPGASAHLHSTGYPRLGQSGGHRAGSTLPLHLFLHPTQERWWWTGAWCRCPLPVLR